MSLRAVNNICLIFIGILVTIEILYGNRITGVYDAILTSLLGIALATSLVVELIIRKKKKQK